MHSEVKQDRPGMCPECGMTLVPTQTKTDLLADKRGHDKHKGHSGEMFFRKFWVSLVLTIPVVLLHFQVFEFPGARFGEFVLGAAIFFYGGWVFVIGAGRELRGKSPGMMTLIAFAISTAFIYSVYIIIVGKGETLFWELATLITVMLLGHYLEMRAVSSAQSALKELSKLLPDEAEVMINPSPTLPSSGEGAKTKIVPVSELKAGDIVLVKPGGKIPADGVVLEGQSDVDESIMTGESRLVAKKPNDQVVAGTINGDGSLKIQVTKIGEKTFLAGVMRLVVEAQASKSRLQILSDRAAFYLTVIAILAGTLTFVVWLLVKGGFTFALERMVAVLVIACPHALGLAIPLVASISTTKAARHGFLVRQRLALEAARNIDVVLFDKTGTLTLGEFGVTEIIPTPFSSPPVSRREIGGEREGVILQLAASVDSHSEHPIAKAIVKEAEKRKLGLLQVKDFQRIPGKGAKAIIDGEEILVGGEAILDGHERATGEFGQKTVIYVLKDKKVLGTIALADVIRSESRDAITALKKMGIKVAMITGDSEDVAKWVAGELGIDEYYARVLPGDKANIVRKLQNSPNPLFSQRGGRGGVQTVVAMVGDGVNDAPALAQADLGIAIGAGTNVAIESAGIILVKNDPRDIVRVIKLSKLTYTKMIQNLFWATGYNVVALPLAAGVLASKGVLLEPALAAVFMSLSTVIVAINALTLRKTQI